MPPKEKSIDTIIKNSDLAQHLSGSTQDSKGQSINDRIKTALNFLYTDLDKTVGKNLPPDVVKYLKGRKEKYIDPEMMNIVETLGEKSAEESFKDYYKLYKDDPEMMSALTNIWEKSGKPYFRRATESEQKDRKQDTGGVSAAMMKPMSRPLVVRQGGKPIYTHEKEHPDDVLKEGITRRDTVVAFPKSPDLEGYTATGFLGGYHNIGAGLEEMAHTYQRARREGESFEDYKKRLTKLHERGGRMQPYSGRYKHLPFQEAVTHKVVSPWLKRPVDDILMGRAVQSRIADFMKKDSRYPQVKVGKTLKSEKQIKEIMGEEFFKNLTDRGLESEGGKTELSLYPFDSEQLKKRGIIPQSGEYSTVRNMLLEGQSPETEYLFKEWVKQIDRNKWEKSSLETQKLPKIESEEDLIEYLDWISKWKYTPPKSTGLVFYPDKGFVNKTDEMGEWTRGEGDWRESTTRGYTPYKK